MIRQRHSTANAVRRLLQIHHFHAVAALPVTRGDRGALAAHHSQATGGGSVRTLALLLRLPGPVLGLALGREWFRERGRQPAGVLLDDVFASLRPRG